MHTSTPSTPTSLSGLRDRLASISSFLSRPLVSTLFAFHPNHLGQSVFSPPQEWQEWWDWSAHLRDGHQPDGQGQEPWLILLRYYESCLSGCQPSSQRSDIPPTLRVLISDASQLALPRDIGHLYPNHPSPSKSFPHPPIPETGPKPSPGMSPKKSHEVACLVAYLATLMSPGSPLYGIRHAVDVGAGQAYLSRALRDQLHLHVLALDWSDVQTQGAARREASSINRKPARTEADNSTGRPLTTGSLTYLTTSIDSASLSSSTKSWLEHLSPSAATVHSPAQIKPVLFVALHACGSLTPDILRAFVSATKSSSSASSSSSIIPWVPQGAIIVGCCYNMMRSEDFLLSQTVHSCSPYQPVHLSSSHLQLAAQVPTEWTRSEQTLKQTRSALRKIVWRALLQDAFENRQELIDEGGPGTSAEALSSRRTRAGRVGRLNDASYTDWETFRNIVQAKVHLQPLSLPKMPSICSERRIEVFHVLRSILGPVIESFILLDRLAWILEELNGSPFTAHLVNLFDQASGSGRNVAIVIIPQQQKH